MKTIVLPALLLAALAACSSSEPTALQGQGKVTPPRPRPPAIEEVADPAPTASRAMTPEERLARAERLRDSLPRIDANSPEQLIVTMQAWERVLRPEVMDAVRLGLTVLPIKLQDRLVQAARATGKTPKLSDQELFRQTFAEVHGMRFDEFLRHVQPLISQYEAQLRNPAALTNPPAAGAGAMQPGIR